MEFKHLQTFKAVVEEGSFLKAASRLQYAQSTITLHIQTLEASLGVQLFVRRGKQIDLTLAGRTLKRHADQLLRRATQLQQAMADLAAGDTGELRIGSVEPVASVHLPLILVQFCRRYPKIRLSLEVGVTRDISRRVASGEIDLAICSPPKAKLGLVFEPLFRDSISLLIPKSNRLANATEMTSGSLASERLILTEEHCPYRDVLEKALQARGINPFSGIESMSSGATKQMVQHGLGIGVMPTTAIAPLPSGTIERQLSDLDLSLMIGLTLNSELCFPGSALDVLAQAIRQDLGEPMRKQPT